MNLEILKKLDDKGKVAFMDLIPVLSGLIGAYKDKTDFTVTTKDWKNFEAIGKSLIGEIGLSGLAHLDQETVTAKLHDLLGCDDNDDILELKELSE